MADPARPRVLAELGTAGWSPAQLLQYEIALEGIRQAVGSCAQRLAAAETAAEPDPALVAELRAEQAAWAARGRELFPDDAAAIDRVRDDAGDLLGVDEEEDDESVD